jgi:hypothetical protein
VQTSLAVEGMSILGGRIYEIAPESPRAYVDRNNPRTFEPVEKSLPGGRMAVWSFPPTSVSVVELDVE